MFNPDNATADIAEYSQTDAALSELKQTYAVVPDLATKDGYAFVKQGISQLTSLRTSIEAARKREKEPYLTAGKMIDAEAKRITAAIQELENPMRTAKQEFDEAQAKKEAERIAKLQAKVDTIIAFVDQAKGQDSTTICALMDRCGEICVDHDFYDLTDVARKAQADSMETLGQMLAERLAFEQSEAERKAQAAEIAKKDAELAELKAKLAAAEPKQEAEQPAPTVEAPQRLARECVQISLDEYNALLDAQRTLAALYAAGVDKWDGYGIAMQQLEQEAA